MRNEVGIRFLLSKKRDRIAYFVAGLGSFCLVIFAFMLGSFFRPYYEHGNSYLPKDTATCVYDPPNTIFESWSECRSLADAINDDSLNRIETISDSLTKAYLLQAQVDDPVGIYVLVGEAGYDFSSLGFLSNTASPRTPSGSEAVVLFDERDNQYNKIISSAFYSLVEKQVDVINAFGVKQEEKCDFRFRPFSYEPGCIAISEDRLPKDTGYKLIEVYLTYHLSSPLSDADLLYYAAKSGFSLGIMTSTMDHFIHPGLPYATFYIPYHSLNMLILALTLVISFSVIASLLVKDVVRSKENAREFVVLRTIGLKKRSYLLSLLFQSFLPLLLSALVAVGTSHLFLVVFKFIVGFSFFYPLSCYLFILALLAMCFLFKCAQAFLAYRSN